MGADKNRKRVGEILDRAMEGEPELLDARHVEEMPPKVLGALGEELMWLMWQHLLEQIYERIRPASLNSTGLM